MDVPCQCEVNTTDVGILYVVGCMGEENDEVVRVYESTLVKLLLLATFR